MIKKIALIGNQNCGKTTLFNALTGSSQHVGNFPGVTVEQKTGFIKKHKDELELIDLPGIYSLSPYTSEEIVSIRYLLEEKPCLIINIIDATNMERNLYLTTQLLELNIPMILVLNMMDEVIVSGNSIDIDGLKERLEMDVVPISASKNEGIEDVITAIEKNLDQSSHHIDICHGVVHKAIHSISHIVEQSAQSLHLPLRYCVTKIIEGDEDMFDKLHIDQGDRHIIEHILEKMEEEAGTDREAALVDMRYSFIEDVCHHTVFIESETKEQIRSEKIDRLLTHKFLGIPIFILIMLFIFYLTFSLIGAPLQDLMDSLIGQFSNWIIHLLEVNDVAYWLRSLVGDGILAGVGSVLSFLPVIVILFFFLSMLEDSGYMARVAFVMDKALRKIGLSGRSFVPMLIGFGCSVPAIMATRTLSSDRDRKMTIILTPFMSCSAKLPIYGMIIAAFFPHKAAIVMLTIYCIGILLAIISAILLKNTVFIGEPVPFVLELPAYRIPTLKNVYLNVLDKAKDFIHKAFTIIFMASIVIWFLQSFSFTFDFVSDSSQSILAAIGSFVSPIFAPLGFNDWRASTALMTGITAKESVVSTLTVLTQSSSTAAFNQALAGIFTPLSAFAFLVFTVLYMPCVAAFAATRRELHSWIQAILTVLFQTGMAYLVAFLIYQIGHLFI
ncbi:ferrous iron transport protein B [Massilimicrobiota timonensis]|uniref:Ferrous iron transport protein B n=1 Tax=Massilimicrobiota timonensis TaxID=1776392 RepID=A0A1Y4SWZ4_9FIRM|nr:ferrous iron transport protein B [Massilimicrobiota timonensis]OUQ33452.1 ferrous iron transport protein B [Massilimicrobiota timonensis]